jgi:hypothetical protein
MPLGVYFPTHYRYTLTAHIDEGWNIAPETDSLVSPAMRFVRSVESKGRDLIIGYEYETLADHVDPAAAAAHLEKLSQVRRLLTYSITPPRTSANAAAGLPAEGTNWPLVLAAVFAGLIAVFGAVQLSRAPVPKWASWPGPPTDGPRGIEGWLLLVGLGVCLTPVLQLVGMVKTVPTYGVSSWADLTTTAGSRYHPLYGPLLLIELVFNVGLIVFGCLQVWLFFKSKRWFPVFFVLFTSFRVLYDWIDSAAADQIPSVHAKGVDYSSHFSPTLAGMIWILYMLNSKRVRNTFVN